MSEKIKYQIIYMMLEWKVKLVKTILFRKKYWCYCFVNSPWRKYFNGILETLLKSFHYSENKYDSGYSCTLYSRVRYHFTRLWCWISKISWIEKLGNEKLKFLWLMDFSFRLKHNPSLQKYLFVLSEKSECKFYYTSVPWTQIQICWNMF